MELYTVYSNILSMHNLFGRLPVDSTCEPEKKSVKDFLKMKGLVVFWEHSGVSAGSILGDEDILSVWVTNHRKQN